MKKIHTDNEGITTNDIEGSEIVPCLIKIGASFSKLTPRINLSNFERNLAVCCTHEFCSAFSPMGWLLSESCAFLQNEHYLKVPPSVEIFRF